MAFQCFPRLFLVDIETPVVDSNASCLKLRRKTRNITMFIRMFHQKLKKTWVKQLPGWSVNSSNCWMDPHILCCRFVVHKYMPLEDGWGISPSLLLNIPFSTANISPLLIRKDDFLISQVIWLQLISTIPKKHTVTQKACKNSNKPKTSLAIWWFP